jgi:hypothetical protein
MPSTESARRGLAAVAAALALVVLTAGSAGAAGPDAHGEAEDHQAMAYPGPAVTEEQILELGRPGPEHAALAPMVGAWRGAVTYWPFPDAPPVTQEATAEKRWILGGRFLEVAFHSTMGGEPFEGRAVVGYDRTAGRYVSTWMDSLSTGILHLAGSREESGAFVLEGDRIDPTTDKRYRVRHVNRVESDAAHVVQFFDELDDGTMFQSLEIRWTRVAP